MRHLFALFLLLSCLITLLPGCEPKEDMVQTSGSLEISADTVLFDTVFTTIGTVTKRLWVYNHNSGAVKTDVSLAGLAGSTYDLIINGDQQTSANGLLIRGKDSVLVLVKARLGDNGNAGLAKDFLVRDELHFRTNGDDQLVRLIAYGQNAYFHRNDVLKRNTVWATDKPHVIINKDTVVGTGTDAVTVSIGVYVPNGVTLTIPSGARIYCHAGATMQVDGTLLVGQDLAPATGEIVKDSSASIVRFRGDRLESYYDDIPGQWGGIFFTETSHGNRIRYTEIKNATFGASILNLGTSAIPDLVLENTTIRNISGSNPSYVSNGLPPGGIVSLSGNVRATNCLLTNCGEYAVLGVGQSTINLNFCTIANYTPSFRRETASLYFDNRNPNDPTDKQLLRVQVTNSIIWGSIEDELYWEGFGDPGYTIFIRNSILRTKDYADEAVLNSAAYLNQLAENDPRFKRTPLNAFDRFDYRLDTLSAASNRPIYPVAPAVQADLVNMPRLSPPDWGAYERINP